MNRTRKIMHFGIVIILMLLFSLLSDLSFGQTDLRSLLELSEKNYPSIAAKQAEAEAAKATLSLDQTIMGAFA